MKFVLSIPVNLRHLFKSAEITENRNEIIIWVTYGDKLTEEYQNPQDYFRLSGVLEDFRLSGVLAEVFKYKEVFKDIYFLMDLRQELKNEILKIAERISFNFSELTLVEIICSFKGSDNLRIKYADYFL